MNTPGNVPDKKTFEKKRRTKIQKLLDSSTLAERKRIKAGLKAGLKLRRKIEQL